MYILNDEQDFMHLEYLLKVVALLYYFLCLLITVIW